MDNKIRVGTESWPRRRKFTHHFFWDSNPQTFRSRVQCSNHWAVPASPPWFHLETSEWLLISAKKENEVWCWMNSRSFTPLLCLWGKQSSHSSSFSGRIFVVAVLIGWSCWGDWQVGILSSALYTGFTLLILLLPVFSLYPCSHLIIGERSFPCSALSVGDTFPYKIWSSSTLSSFKSLNLGGFFVLF